MQLVGCSECCHAVSRVHERFGRCYAVLRVFFKHSGCFMHVAMLLQRGFCVFLTCCCAVDSVLGGLNFLFKYLS